MAFDTIIDYVCEPKRRVGDGFPGPGTVELLALYKVHAQASAVRVHAARSGQNPAALRVRLVSVGPEGQTSGEHETTLSELEEQSQSLEMFDEECRACPASPGQRLCGCIGMMPEPITVQAEAWLLERLMPPDTPGGYLLLSAIRDFHYDGDVVRQLRTVGVFQGPLAQSRPLPVNPFGRAEVTSDHVFHAIFGVGPRLSAWHIAMVLCWIGSIAHQDRLPETLDDFEAITQLPVSLRPSRTSLRVGLPSEDRGIRQLQHLLFTMYQAWCLDVPLMVSM